MSWSSFAPDLALPRTRQASSALRFSFAVVSSAWPTARRIRPLILFHEELGVFKTRPRGIVFVSFFRQEAAAVEILLSRRPLHVGAVVLRPFIDRGSRHPHVMCNLEAAQPSSDDAAHRVTNSRWGLIGRSDAMASSICRSSSARSPARRRLPSHLVSTRLCPLREPGATETKSRPTRTKARFPARTAFAGDA